MTGGQEKQNQLLDQCLAMARALSGSSDTGSHEPSCPTGTEPHQLPTRGTEEALALGDRQDMLLSKLVYFAYVPSQDFTFPF